MAFVYCKKCDWSQDDFWSKNYNPLKFLHEAWEDSFLEHKLNEPLNGHFDSNMLKETGLDGKVWRDFWIHELGRKQKQIGKMKWMTERDFKDDPNPTCPECGGHSFEMD